MKIKKWLMLGMVSLLVFTLSGCGEKEQEAPEAAEDKNESGGDFLYVAEYEELKKDGYSTNNIAIGKDGQAFFSGVKDGEVKLFSKKMGGEVEEVPVELGENTTIGAIGTDLEGNLLLGLITYSEALDSLTTAPENVIVRKITADGTVLKDIDIGKSLINGPEFYIQALLEDKDENYYISTGQKVFVLKPNGEVYFEVDAGGYISNVFSMKGEKTVVANYGDMGWEMREVDLAGKALKALDTPITFEYGTYQSGGTDADILYTMGTKLYSYNLGENEPTEILNWVDSDIDSGNLRGFSILEDGKVAAVSMDWSSEEGKAELAILTKKDRSEIPEKIVLTYGTTHIPYFVKTDVVAFNKQSDKYRIEIKEYGEGDKDYETMLNLWTADMSSGNGPDIIDMYYCPVGLQELVSMGVVEDLNPYFDADAEVDREDFVDSAMRAYELDGKLYAIMRCFGLATVAGKVSDVGEGDTWTLDDVFALMESKDSDVELFQYTTKYNALQMMMQVNGDMFVSEDGTCNFESEEFRKILEFANRFPKDFQYDPTGASDIEKIREGKLLLVEEIVTSVQYYQFCEAKFGEPVNLIGYPTSGESGILISPNGTTAAMNVNSKNKEGVWEFFKFLMAEEQQENLQSANSGFPIMRSVLEKQFEKDMQPEYYEDTDGTQKEKPKGVWTTGSSGEVTIDVYAATQEQVDSIKQMIEIAQNTQIDSKMLDIIMEEAQSYFDGQKSVEEVSALIQNRIQIYISEKR